MSDIRSNNIQSNAIQWFPGHMTKAFRMLKESLSLVDVVIELADARIPRSSRNPMLDELAAGKGRVVVLAKADLADEALNAAWKRYYEARGLTVALNNHAGAGMKQIAAAARALTREKRERQAARGRLAMPTRAMVVGAPNVGKSTLINRCAGHQAAKVGDRPGVTKGRQWVKVSGDLELLDTPGVLWPKFDDPAVGLRLALTGAINDDILEPVALAREFLSIIKETKPAALSYYNAEDAADPLAAVGKRRGCVVRGGEIDLTRAAKLVIDDFRKGKAGRLTLERPPE